jgi:aspartyl/asparaginyl beta-hydroxylase
MTGAYRLPLRFDPAPLREEVAEIERHVPWVNHWASEGDAWQLIPLLVERAGAPAEPTAALEQAPRLRDVLATFRTDILRARLSKLCAGTSIKRHRDFAYFSERRWSFERGLIRLHGPIVTDDDVTWRLQDRPVDLRPGEFWYLNVCLPHSVENRSRQDRIHLVVELVVNDWVRSVFPPESAWDRLRGVALRRVEPAMWELIRPLWTLRQRLEGRPTRAV